MDNASQEACVRSLLLFSTRTISSFPQFFYQKMPTNIKLYDVLGKAYPSDLLVHVFNCTGVAPSASSDEIKKAFREQALRWHPDKNHGDVEVEEKFKGG
jgi:hypothetical protein